MTTKSIPTNVHTIRKGYYGVGSVEVTPGKEGEGGVRRLAISADKLITDVVDGIETTADMIDYIARTHGTRNAVGWREVVKLHIEEKEVKKVVEGKEVMEKKKWQYFELSDYKYLSYVDFKAQVEQVARGLVDLGVPKGAVFNIYSQTSLNWQSMCHACALIGVPCATAYDTLGESGLKHSLNEPECIGLFTNAELLPTLYNVLKDTPTIKFVIYDGEAKTGLVEDIRKVREDIQALHIDEVKERGKKLSDDLIKDRRPSKDTLALIMYTSGSTGPPKGVCITHSNLISSIGGVKVLLGHHLTLEDTFLAYLPLAHILEFIVENIMLFVGIPIGYGRVKTLTDSSVRNCKGDIVTFRPSIMIGVPAVWETIRKGILAKVNSSGTISKSVFKGAIAAKKGNVPVLGSVADSVVLSGVRNATGGRLRLAMCGGAALSRETQEFLHVALVTMLLGYGMTETCGMCTILPPEYMQYGSVGLPVPCTEIKLLDVPDAGYLSTNNPPQGEVCLRGGSVVREYFKRPDLNADTTVFAGDGWFRTGDVGQWNEDGTLSLIDRIKNLVKLSGGEYIALEKLEAVYKGCNLVSNICVHANQDSKQPIAIIIPHEAHLRHFLANVNNLPSSIDPKSTPLPDLCKEVKVKEWILKECNSAGKKNGFKSLELLEGVILTADEWTPENGLVTAAQKINRRGIAGVFDAEIKEIIKNQ